VVVLEALIFLYIFAPLRSSPLPHCSSFEPAHISQRAGERSPRGFALIVLDGRFHRIDSLSRLRTRSGSLTSNSLFPVFVVLSVRSFQVFGGGELPFFPLSMLQLSFFPRHDLALSLVGVESFPSPFFYRDALPFTMRSPFVAYGLFFWSPFAIDKALPRCRFYLFTRIGSFSSSFRPSLFRLTCPMPFLLP